MHVFEQRKMSCDRGKAGGGSGALRGSLQLREGRNGELVELH